MRACHSKCPNIQTVTQLRQQAQREMHGSLSRVLALQPKCKPDAAALEIPQVMNMHVIHVDAISWLPRSLAELLAHPGNGLD